ncbi:MAG: hypothetical protein JWQ03_2667 [Variovorax sp.]|nr:hypothetical protein [Variovorax sp.]
MIKAWLCCFEIVKVSGSAVTPAGLAAVPSEFPSF